VFSIKSAVADGQEIYIFICYRPLLFSLHTKFSVHKIESNTT
jgi:hypothetical protein